MFTVRVDVTRSLSIVISHQRLIFLSKGVSSLHQEDSAAERRMLALLEGMLLKFIELLNNSNTKPLSYIFWDYVRLFSLALYCLYLFHSLDYR